MGRDYVVVSCKAAESPKLLWASEAPVGVQPCQVAAPVGFERDWCDAKMITSLHHAEGHGVKQLVVVYSEFVSYHIPSAS